MAMSMILTNKILLDDIAINVVLVVNLILLFLVGATHAEQECDSNSEAGLTGARRCIEARLEAR